jgi:hypothetical protein
MTSIVASRPSGVAAPGAPVPFVFQGAFRLFRVVKEHVAKERPRELRRRFTKNLAPLRGGHLKVTVEVIDAPMDGRKDGAHVNALM